MFCKNCGTKLSDDSVFCTNCGERVSTTPNGPEVADEPQTSAPADRPEMDSAAAEGMADTVTTDAPKTMEQPASPVEQVFSAAEGVKTAEFTTAAPENSVPATPSLRDFSLPPQPPTSTPLKKKSKAGLVLGIAGGVTALILILAIIVTVTVTKGHHDTTVVSDQTTTDDSFDQDFDGEINTNGNTVVNILSLGFATIQDDTIYYMQTGTTADADLLMEMDADGSDQEVLCSFDGEIYYINAVGDQIFFNGDSTSEDGTLNESGIYCYDLEDETLTTVYTSSDYIYDLYVSSTKMYFSTTNSVASSCRIYTANLDGSGMVSLVQEDDYIDNLAVTGDAIYYSYGDSVYRCGLDGNNSTELYAGKFLANFSLDDSALYIADCTDDDIPQISALGLDGSNESQLVQSKDTNSIDYINVSNNVIYYVDNTYDDGFENMVSGKIYSMNPDGSNQKELVTVDGGIVGLSVCGNWLFYYDYNASSTEKISL